LTILLTSAALAKDLKVDASYAIEKPEDVQTATIAVSPKGKVALAIATPRDLQVFEVTKAGGPLKRWTLAAPVAAGGEDRPVVGFAGNEPWVVALRKDGDLVAIHVPTNKVTRIGQKGERECLIAGEAPMNQ